jgi:Abortive infection alpha
MISDIMDGTEEILKSGAVANLTDLLKKLAGPAFEELGAVLADNVRVYRVKNLLKTTEKTKRILQDAGLHPNPIPSRLLLPILDTCSVEDNDDLQERWAGLLASASQEADSLSPSFIETLKQLTPNEAKHYDHIFVEVSKLYKGIPTSGDPVPPQAFTKAWGAPKGVRETYERLGLIRRDYNVKVESGSWRINFDPKDFENTVSDIESALDDMEAEVEYQYFFTVYAMRFLRACRGPQREEEQVSASDDE